MASDLIALVAGPLVTAFIGSVGIWLEDWRRDRDLEHKRQQALQTATNTVTFLERWVKTQELICTPDEMADIRRIAQRQMNDVSFMLWQTSARAAEKRGRTSLRQALLLYRPESIAGWIARIMFYLWLIMLFFYSVGIWQQDPRPVEVVIGYALFFIPILLFRWWAVSSDSDDEIEATDTATVSSTLFMR
jgi:hypothetical protein